MNIYKTFPALTACVAAVLLASACATQNDVRAVPEESTITGVEMPEQIPFDIPTDESDDLWPVWRSNQEMPPELIELGQLMSLDAIALPRNPKELESIAVGLLGRSCIVLIQDRGVDEKGVIYSVARVIPRSKHQFNAANYDQISGYGIAADFGRLKTEMHGITCRI